MLPGADERTNGNSRRLGFSEKRTGGDDRMVTDTLVPSGNNNAHQVRSHRCGHFLVFPSLGYPPIFRVSQVFLLLRLPEDYAS